MTVKNFDQKGASLFDLPISDKSGGLNLLGKGSGLGNGSIGNSGLGKGDDIAQPGIIAPSRDRRDIEDATESRGAGSNNVYVFNPDNFFDHEGFGHERRGYFDFAQNGGTDTLRLHGVGELEVYIRRGAGSHVYIEDYDSSFSLGVQLSGSNAIERVHFDENGNGDEDDGDDNILTKDELLTAITENVAIYVNHPGFPTDIGDGFFYRAGDGHQFISDQDNNGNDHLVISGWSPGDVTLTRNNDAPVRDYNTPNADAHVRTYDDLQLEFRDGKTILLKRALDGSNRGVDSINFYGNNGRVETTWTKADIIDMARDLVTQSSEDQYFHGFAEDDSYIYSRGDGHDTIFEGRNKGNDVLVLKGGISSSDATASYSNAGRSYIDASDYGAGDIANPNPDLLIEFGGVGAAATGSVLLVLGAVDGFGVESILFDENDNGVADVGEILWDKDYMLVAAGDVYVYDPDDHSSHHLGSYSDENDDYGTDTLRLTGVRAHDEHGEPEVRVRRGRTDSHVFIEDYDNRFTLELLISGSSAIERVHFDENGNGIEDDGYGSILTNDELLTMVATEDMAIYVDHSHDRRVGDEFFYSAGDVYLIIGDQDDSDADSLNIYGWGPDEVILTRNAEDPVRDYNARNADDLVRTYDDLQLEFPDGQTILLKYVLEGSDRGVDSIHFYEYAPWTKADMIREARALVTQSSEDQNFHGFAEDDTYIYSRGDGHDTILEGHNKGNDVLMLRGLSRRDITVSYSDASDRGVGAIANPYPDLFLEFEGRGGEANGSVLLALGAMDDYGVESILFDENDNGIADANEILWDKDDMFAAAEETAEVDDVYVFNTDDYRSVYHWGYYYDQDQDGGIDTLSMKHVREHEVYVRRGPHIGGDFVFIEAKDNSFTLLVPLSGDRAIERFHFDELFNGPDDTFHTILTKDELLTMVATEDRAIYVDSPDSVSRNEFFYRAGDGHLIISDEDNDTSDYLVIYGWGPDDVILTRNNDDIVRDYNAPLSAGDPVRTYDDLQLEFRDGKTILLKDVLDGSDRGVDYIDFDVDDDGTAESKFRWTKADMMRLASDLEDPQSSEDQIFYGLPQDDFYIYSRGDGHDTIFDARYERERPDLSNDVLAVRGISSSDATVSFSYASDTYINARDYGYSPGSSAHPPDLLIEFGGVGDAATGSVLLALGNVGGGFGVESVFFDENDNGIADVGEVSWSKAEMSTAANKMILADDLYVFNPDNYSGYHYVHYYDLDQDGGSNGLNLTGVDAGEVRIRRANGGHVYIEAYDNSYTLYVNLDGYEGIERVHFDKNGNHLRDDGDHNFLTNDELLTMVATNAIEDMAIYVDHPDDSPDYFYYDAGDGHQIISDKDDDVYDHLFITGWSADEVILTRNNDDPVGDYNTRNGEELVRTYNDLQLEFPDGQTILLKYVLEGSNRGIDRIWFDTYDYDGDTHTSWTKADMMREAYASVTQSSEDQTFHGLPRSDFYIYSPGDGHDTIFEDHDAGNDVLVLQGGISSSDATVSYSNASRSYINISDYDVGDTLYTDLLIEFGGVGAAAATGSVLLALGAMDGYGVESVLFDTNDNGVADVGEVSWSKDDMLAAAATIAVADDIYFFNPDDYSGYHSGNYFDYDEDGGTDALSLTGVRADEVRVRRGHYSNVYIEAYDHSFKLYVILSGTVAIERVHFAENGAYSPHNFLTRDELLTMVATENMAIYENQGSDNFYYDAGDGHLFISDKDNSVYDYLYIKGWGPDEVILTRNDDLPVRDYNTRHGEDPVPARGYDDLQLEFPDGKTILLKYVLDGSNRGVDEIWFSKTGDKWTQDDMIRMARALVTQSSEDQTFYGFAEDDSYEYSLGDGHDTIFEARNKGNDVLVLKGGISSSDVTVSYSDASNYNVYQPGTHNDLIEYPDLLLEFGGRGDAANGSVLLAIGAVDGYGVEGIHFDENGNGIVDAGEISWDKDEMLAAADATAAADLFG